MIAVAASRSILWTLRNKGGPTGPPFSSTSDALRTRLEAGGGVIDQQRGFTLVELMVVVAIIATLAAIALPAYQSYIIKSQLTAALADINSARSIYESKLIAENIASFDPDDIGLAASTPRCSAINLVSGVTGHIECIVQGSPPINGNALRIIRTASGTWSCSTAAGTHEEHKPNHCS